MDNKRNYYLASAGIAATIVGSTLIGNGLDTSHNHDLQLDPKPLIEKTDINIDLTIFQETSDPLEVCNTPEKKYISEKLTMEVGFGIESKDTYAILSMDDCLRQNYLSKVRNIAIQIENSEDLYILPGMNYYEFMKNMSNYRIVTDSIEHEAFVVLEYGRVELESTPHLKLVDISVWDSISKKFISTNYSIIVKYPHLNTDTIDKTYLQEDPIIIGIVDWDNQYTLTVNNIENPLTFSNYYPHSKPKDRNTITSDTLGEH